MSYLQQFLKRRSAAAVAGLAIIALTLLFTACPEDAPTYSFVCENGTPGEGKIGVENIQQCSACNAGFALTDTVGVGSQCLAEYSFVCENGTPREGKIGTQNIHLCIACNTGFALTNTAGVGAQCLTDTDNDNIANTVDTCPTVPNVYDQRYGHACDADIDNDNDGLIEIWTLEQLHNMRYDLAGSSYKTSSTDTGITTGANTAEPANCDDSDTATTVVLCGYELAQSLDFDLDGDGTTVSSDGTLDAGDNAAPHFVVSDGGWEPIGTTRTISFSAVFDGNGNTINNLVISRSQLNVGLFGTASTRAHIRNIGIVNGFIRNGGLDDNISRTGGLVGHADITVSITASYFQGSVRGTKRVANGGSNAVGGLVGRSAANITASYASGDVAGSEVGADEIGGLVGVLNGGYITASYATGNVASNGGDSENIGGLVGGWSSGSVIASYATGNVDGGGGTLGTTGALINRGARNSAVITASYGFGEVTNVGGATGISTKPTGVTAATGLTLDNAGTCSVTTHTTKSACTGASATWTDWNGQTDSMNAWIFATGKAPRLRYADYDGAGTDYACSLFPSTVNCGANGDPLPGQPTQ